MVKILTHFYVRIILVFNGVRIETQNCTSKFHNLSYMNPI